MTKIDKNGLSKTLTPEQRELQKTRRELRMQRKQRQAMQTKTGLPTTKISKNAVFPPLRILTLQIEQAFAASLNLGSARPIPGLRRFNEAMEILQAKAEAEHATGETPLEITFYPAKPILGQH